MGPNPDLPLDCQTYMELVTVVDTCEEEMKHLWKKNNIHNVQVK